MKNNLFLSIIKYSFNEKKSPKENFLTESLSYFLKNSLNSNCALINDFLHLLNCSEFIVRNIETQKQFFINNKIGYVDLVLETIQNVSLLIEIKYEAEINDYEIINKDNVKQEINQIDLYNQINCEKRVFLLTVSNYENKKCKNIYWYQVYELFKKYCKSDVLTNQFVELMEHLKMRLQNTSRNLNQSSNDIFALLSILKEAINKTGMRKYRSKLSGDVNYFGYYINSSDEIIKKKCQNNYAWVGIYQKEDNLVIAFEIWDNTVNKKIRNNTELSFLKDANLTKIEWSKHKNLLLEPFVFNNDFYDAEPINKIQLIENWLKDHDKRMVKIYESI